MSPLPVSYLYLLKIDTDEALAAYSLNELTPELEIITFEAQIRAQEGVDDPESG